MNGLLFSSDFLCDAICRIYADVNCSGTWNKAHAEEDIIAPTLSWLRDSYSGA